MRLELWDRFRDRGTGHRVYQECTLCHNWTDKGLYVSAEWICDNCVSDTSDGDDDTMDVKMPTVVHMKLKPKGSPEAAEFFLFVMAQIDKDWPKPDAPKCEHCGGVTWRLPSLKPADLRKLAQTCGLGKLKIPYWGDADDCAGKVMV